MATTEHFYPGTGSQTTFPFEFPYLADSDVKVKLFDSSTGNFELKQQNTSGQNKDYSISNTNIVFNTAPPTIAGVNSVHIYRDTDIDTARAVYGTGSAIRAQDLNNNTNQALYSLQEERQLIQTSEIKDEAITSAKIKDGTIVNADVSTSAAIAGTKVTPAFGSQNLSTTGTAATGALTVTGAIAVSTTVDGRDVAADGTKLDGIESNATADQTNAEIRAAVEAASDSNVFTDADHTKLNGISANADVTSTKAIGDLSNVDTTGVANGKILKYASSSNSFIIADDGGTGTGITNGDKGDITIANAGTVSESFTIDNLAVTGAKIANQTITAGKLAANSVISNHIDTQNVTTPKIADGNITTVKIADTNVTTAKIADANVTTAKIADANVTTAKLADNSVTSAKIVDGAIVNADINASAAIDGTKISPDFGSQAIATTGNLSTNQINTTGVININSTYPSLNLVDTNNNSDYSVRNNNGQFAIQDTTNSAQRFTIAANGTVNVLGNLDVGATCTATAFAGDGSALTGLASTTAGGAIYENSQTISQTHTIPSGSNGMSAGPVSVNNGVTLTISSGSTYTVV